MTPLMTYLVVFIAVVVVAGIAVGIYYTVKEDDGKKSLPDVDANWVMVGQDTSGMTFGGWGNILYSADGKEWRQSIGVSFATEGFGVAYGTSNGTSPLWVAVGDDGRAAPGRVNIMYSADGKEWQESTGASFANRGYGVAYGTSNGTSPLWVAVGDGNGGWSNIMYSADGKEWQESTGMSFSNSGRGVAYGTSNGTSPLWVAVGFDFINNPGWGNIMYSADGKEWQQTNTGASFASLGKGVAYGTSNGTSPLWVAVGRDSGGGKIMYSDNGIEWQESTGESFGWGGFNVAYRTVDGSAFWIATGKETENDGPGQTLISTNGKAWQTPTDVFNTAAHGVAFKSILPNVPNF